MQEPEPVPSSTPRDTQGGKARKLAPQRCAHFPLGVPNSKGHMETLECDMGSSGQQWDGGILLQGALEEK